MVFAEFLILKSTNFQIVDYLTTLAEDFPDRIFLKRLENSVQNRTIYSVTIKSGIINNTAIFIEAGTIAREWLSISCALFIIKEVGTNVESHPTLNNLDWIIIPVVNPDGYEISFQNASVFFSVAKNS